MLKYSIATLRKLSNADNLSLFEFFTSFLNTFEEFTKKKKSAIFSPMKVLKLKNFYVKPCIYNDAVRFFFCCAIAIECNFVKIGLGSTKKSLKYAIDVPAIFGNFLASFPKPSKQTTYSGM